MCVGGRWDFRMCVVLTGTSSDEKIERTKYGSRTGRDRQNKRKQIRRKEGGKVREKFYFLIY
jgi:hypothetical protein